MKDVLFSNVMGYKIINEDMDTIIDFINSINKVHIVSGNPEVLNSGLEFRELHENFTSDKALIIPDGVGTIVAARLLGRPIRKKIAGIELMEEIIKNCNKKGLGIYLLGSKKDVLDSCITKLKAKYKNLIVCGSHDGYFDLNNCEEIIKNIREASPYAVFVAMGCPRQEKFIIKYFDKLSCKVFMGVGGSFDVIAQKTKRAPSWMIKFGLEWLYRTIKEPFRIKRLFVIPAFIFKAVINKNKL